MLLELGGENRGKIQGLRLFPSLRPLTDLQFLALPEKHTYQMQASDQYEKLGWLSSHFCISEKFMLWIASLWENYNTADSDTSPHLQAAGF